VNITNRFNIGDVVYYPAADLRAARIFKAAITGIIIRETEGKVELIYQTGQSYGVSEEDMFKTAKPAKRRLIKILQEKKKEVAKDIDGAVKTVDGTKTEELVYDLTAKNEEPKEEPEDVETTEDA